jgi:L-malate glycosyltransferase
LIGVLIERGHDVSVYTTSSDISILVPKPIQVQGTRFRIYYCPVRPHAIRFHHGLPGRILDGFAHERRHLLRAIDLDQPDIVHAHWTYEFALAGMASNRPCVVTAHDSPVRVLRYTPDPYRFGRLLMAIGALRRARFLTAVSPYIAEQVTRFTKVPAVVIPNPMPNVSTGAVNSQRRDCIRKMDVPPVIAMILNGWGRLKNPMMGLKAFGLLRTKIVNARLRLYGHDFGPGGLAERWAKARGLEAGVEFVGSIPHRDLVADLPTVDLLLHPALEESCPLALVEAMTLGVPIVAGEASGGVPWVLNHGECGVLTNVRSANAMCEALLDLIQDRGRYMAIREAAVRRAQEVFDASAVAQQYEQQYRCAMGQAARTTGV